MNVQDMTLAKLAEIDEGGFPYRVHMHCVMTDELKCPESTRLQFPTQIMFTLDSTLKHVAHWDWETRIFSFLASFNGIHTTIEIPAQNIGAIMCEDGTVTQFGTTSAQPAQPAQPVQRKNHTRKNSKLKLVVDNTK